MKNKAIKTKLLTVLLALCMVLSLVPMTAFAATIELPAGVSREYLYNHTYHTKVEITANVSVKDAGGSVIETAQVNKFGDFIEGNVSNTAVQAEIQGFDAEINAPYSSRGTLAVENRTTSLEFDHFEGNNLYSFIPASGDTVDFGTDTEAIEQYFAEHPDAVGTFNTFNDLHEYQVYHITYDLIVQESGTTPSAVENVKLNYENISYKAGDIPHTTASVSEGNCAVAYEYWTEIRRPEGGGQWYETGRRWYSDSDKMASLPADERIIKFEAGYSYQYNVVLAAGSGYSFSNDETVVSVGEDEWGTPGSHKKLEIKESGKELHIKRIYTFDLPNAGQPNAITSAAVENVKLDYKPGDAPRATATVAAADQGKYRIYDEYWQELNENGEPVAIWHSRNGRYSTLPTFTAFESGKKYVYSVLLMPEGEYDFARGVAATVNGNAVTAVPAVDGYLSLPNVKTITPAADSHTHDYGEDWKYDETNHWHECACGDKADTAVHIFKWVTDKEATATEKGSKHEECTVCGYKKAAVDIPATGSGNGSAVQPQKPGNTSSPQTGDNNSLALWFAVLFISGGALTVLGITSKKKSKNALKQS